ncbi:hypothetical protein [Tropicimonas sp. IMCC6043]|uniref:hypothetical protein n=1 Tax=Tropicimonas sp. IMCC6043 TaxID=2510645 RepID=UPI00101C525F|nr:hypothetical protein [Tropicimonas sp. IMCC6043]RYH11321.1 hypothetical protein EU800_05520 [Tropicimonas sp. IMCC6043]
MSTDGIKPRRVVEARRVLALGASAAVLGAASGAAPMTPTWITPKSLVHQVDAEGEGSEAPVEAEGEAESGGDAESESGEGGEGAVSAEGESEGGDATAEASDRSGTLVVIGGLLRAAEALRAAGYPEAGALVEEAAEAAEHGLDGALAE